MIKFALVSLVLFTSLTASAQPGDDFKLPKEWAKDFTILLAYHGSMSGGYTDVKFTYDSIKYNSTPGHSKKPVSRVYLLKEADRIAIFKKLHELKIDEVKSESSVHVVHDGWSQTICLGGFHCIDGGTSSEMTEKDKNAFLDAYRYLEEFAIKKSR